MQRTDLSLAREDYSLARDDYLLGEYLLYFVPTDLTQELPMKYVITLLVIIATMSASTAFADKNDNASAKLADLAELEKRQ